MNSKRLLVLNYEFPPLGGGGGKVCAELVEAMVKATGWQVDIVTMGYGNLRAVEKISPLITVYRVKCFRSRKEMAFFPELLSYVLMGYLKARQLVRKHHYDLCHAHFLIPTGIIALLLKKQFRLEYVLSAHGSDIPGYNPDRFRLLHRFTKPLLKSITSRARSIFVPSSNLKSLLLQQVSKDLENKIIVIPNGTVDIHQPSVKKQKIILSAGRFLKRKGFDILINAFKKITDQSWQLVLLGDGPEKNKLHKLAAGDRRIQFLGWLDNTLPPYHRIFNQASIMALLSRVESQGIVFVEAMSAGCAIVTSSDLIGNDILSTKFTLFADRDTDSLTEILLSLISNPAKLKKYQMASRRTYQDIFTWDKVVSKYLSYF